MKLSKKDMLIPVCPEQLGGLSTPRERSERKGAQVFTRSGKDVTNCFKRGAEKVLAIAKSLGIKSAIFKGHSPSCGSGKIYDGSFSGKVIEGDGVTTALLKRNRIKVMSEGMIKKMLVVFVAISLCTLSDSYADIIRLKNKRTIEGVIVKETANSIVMDIGLGTVAVSKEQIESVEDTANGSDQKAIEIDAEATNAMRKLSKELRGVKKKRLEAVKHKSRHESQRVKLANIERELTSLYVKFENLNNKLRRMKKDNVMAYNNVVAEVNSTSARISKFNSERSQSQKMRADLDSAVSQSVSDYSEALASLRANFAEVYTDETKRGLEDSDETFYIDMREALGRLRKDFEHKEIEYSGTGSEIMVDVTLNNRVTATMLVDTGASVLLISRDVANQLRLYDGGGARKITVSLANGSTTTATPVVLQSVQVGDALVKNVRAAISETPPSSRVEGLLGMSFLSNFVLRIDSKANKMILEEFKPNRQQ